jgi:UDP-N-acetylmuramate dehydrogenase
MTGLGFLEENYPISRLTTVGTGGPARFLARPSSADDLQQLVSFIDDQGLEMAVVGLGSNLLAADQGFAGVVVKLVGDLARVERDGDGLLCGGGASLAVVVKRAEGLSLAGAEFFCAIPGTVGGAVRMNAGAYGREVKDILVEARLVLRDGSIETWPLQKLGYTYRHSDVPEGAVVVEALFQGVPGDPAQIGAEMDRIAAEREASQPLRSRTGGSTFKNPPGHKAWALVDAAGCRGLRVGDAQVSEKHCNFLLNLGNASSSDIEELGELVRRRVQDRTNITLEWEIQRIGVQ